MVYLQFIRGRKDEDEEWGGGGGGGGYLGSLLCEAYDYMYIVTYTHNLLAYFAHRDPNAYFRFLV